MIRWINKKIGTAAWSSVISVPDYFKLDVRELVDDYGNNNEHIANLIKNGIEILKEFNKLIICCEYGMSRSNAIAVAIISITENISFERSLECVINSVKENQIKLEVLKSVSEYLKQKRTEFKKSKNILLIDHNGFIAKRITKKTKKDNYLILSHGINFSILLSNPARLYLFICKNNVEKIVLISIAQITNTNSYVNNLLYFLKNILDVCTITLSKFIFLSSLDVYNGIKVKTLLLNSKSNQKKKPEGAKGIAFSLAEELIFYYQNKLNSNFSIIRIPTTYGHDKIQIGRAHV